EVTYHLERSWDSAPTTATLHGRYRGQRIAHKILLKQPAPDTIVYRYPRPATAGVAVRLDEGFNYGAVSIVLDCSGSMATKDQPDPKKPGSLVSRFDYAIMALDSVLASIPDGTYVSLFVFGLRADKEEYTFIDRHFPSEESNAKAVKWHHSLRKELIEELK